MGPSYWKTELRIVAKLYREARQRRDKTIVKAVASGVLTRRQVADTIGLSKPRIDQIVRAAEAATEADTNKV